MPEQQGQPMVRILLNDNFTIFDYGDENLHVTRTTGDTRPTYPVCKKIIKASNPYTIVLMPKCSLELCKGWRNRDPVYVEIKSPLLSPNQRVILLHACIKRIDAIL